MPRGYVDLPGTYQQVQAEQVVVAAVLGSQGEHIQLLTRIANSGSSRHIRSIPAG